MKIEVRDLREEDLDEVCAIEESSFSMPWRREDFQGLIEDNNSIYLVILSDDRVVGAAGYTFNGFDGYINNVVIDVDYRGQGLGRVLLQELLRVGRKNGVPEFTLEVRASNVPAIKLYESLGFKSEGRRKNFYERPTEDAEVMWLRDVKPI
ncbi:MAG: ribosomal protein S18-alanine N-acetyltransferase [Lachnospiraceae bacterium]|nr:ribosomal protein S18-alanine N-acetyltransferase [Lachnospiraceae bacterium]